MPLSLRDRQLSTIYNALEQTSGSEIGDSNLLDVLAAVGDGNRKTAATVRQELSGLDKPAQLALVKAGMAATEKKDLAKILDHGSVALSPQAKNFLAALLDREPLDTEQLPDLALAASQLGGLSGVTNAGWLVEAINLSTAPSGRLHTTDVMVVAEADAQGKFTGGFAGQLSGTQQGDLLRIRARDKNTGAVTGWLNVRANGLAAADTRNAQLATMRIGLSAKPNGTVEMLNINGSRQISEPFATLELTNKRTNEKVRVKLNAEGTFDAPVMLKGNAGDVFSVAVSDGTNNTSLTQVSGKVTVPVESNGGNTIDLPDPKLHRDELNPDGTPRFQKIRFTGTLFDNGVSPVDVRQGQIGDCYLPAAVASIAQVAPERLRDMVKQNADGTYTVTFKEAYRGGYRDVRVTVDGDLYVRASSAPLYGSTNGPQGATELEMWWPVLEKAYASWKGSYDVIGQGGHSSDVFEDFLGAGATQMWISEGRQEALWKGVKEGIDARSPLALGTYSESEEARYTGTGVYTDHAYSVLDYRVEANGERMVQIRNPWGESAPNEEHDGIFWMKLSDVAHLFQTMYKMI